MGEKHPILFIQVHFLELCGFSISVCFLPSPFIGLENIIRPLIFRIAASIRRIVAGAFAAAAMCQWPISKPTPKHSKRFFFAMLQSLTRSRLEPICPSPHRALFAFVARRSGSAHDNQCHVFCELEATQPAAAITSFAGKVIPSVAANALARHI